MATSAQTDSTQLLGIIKDTFAEKKKDARVEVTVIQDKFKLDTSKSPVGKAFHLPVLVTNSQSTTYDVSQGVSTLTTAIAPQSVDAQVATFETTETLNIPFGMMAQADMGAKVSYASEQVIKMFSLWRGIQRQVEWSLAYGGTPVGSVGTMSNPGGGTTATITFTAGTFSPGYVSGMENAPIDLYSAYGGTQYNTNALVRVTAVDTDLGTLTVSGNNADLVAAYNAWNVPGPLVVLRYGENGKVCVGLFTQLANTASTLITNLDPTKYNILKGNLVTAVGNAGVQKFAKYVARAKNKGATGDAVLFSSTDVFGALSAELSQLRRNDVSYDKGKLENGAETIKVRVGSVAFEVQEYVFLKTGESYLTWGDNVVRPGVSDIVDNLSGEDLSVMSSTTNSYQWRTWTSQAMLYTAPAQGLALQGITIP